MKGSEKMKTKLSNIIKKAIKGAAIISSESTSLTGLYQPKTPDSLLKSEKKK